MPFAMSDDGVSKRDRMWWLRGEMQSPALADLGSEHVCRVLSHRRRQPRSGLLSLTPKWWSLPSSGGSPQCLAHRQTSPPRYQPATTTQAARTSPSHPACGHVYPASQRYYSVFQGKAPVQDGWQLAEPFAQLHSPSEAVSPQPELASSHQEVERAPSDMEQGE